MSSVTAFAMTAKGLAVLDAVSNRFPGLITTVVGSRDLATHDDQFEGIRQLCRSRSIEFTERERFDTLTTEFALAVSWRWLISAPSSKLIVFHDSLLPHYRGFNPLVTALINGDAEVGVTALYGATEYDRGDVIGSAAMTLSYPCKIGDVIERICPLYVGLALQLCTDLVRGVAPRGTAQNHAAATYSLWRDEHDYFINWATSAQQIKRTVDALGYPYKGAACWIGGSVARVTEAVVLDDVVIANRDPGKVIFVHEGRPVVVCGQGLLRIDEMTDDDGRPLLPLQRFRQRLDRRSN